MSKMACLVVPVARVCLVHLVGLEQPLHLASLLSLASPRCPEDPEDPVCRLDLAGHLDRVAQAARPARLCPFVLAAPFHHLSHLFHPSRPVRRDPVSLAVLFHQQYLDPLLVLAARFRDTLSQVVAGVLQNRPQ